MKKIYRSKNDKKLAGVCGGIASYFNIDSTIIRLIWVGVSILAGAGTLGLIAYIVCAFVIPEEPDAYDVEGRYVDNNQNENNQNYQNTQQTTYYDPNDNNSYQNNSYNQDNK